MAAGPAMHKRASAAADPHLARKLLCSVGNDQRSTIDLKTVRTVFNNIFGIHEQALLLRGQRVGVLAANLANADTPNYKARDFDFDTALAGMGGAAGTAPGGAAPLTLNMTQPDHLPSADAGGLGVDLQYRNPYQASLDGNTVESPVEQAAFAENSVRYQASLAFINQTIASLQLAIAGQ